MQKLIVRDRANAYQVVTAGDKPERVCTISNEITGQAEYAALFAAAPDLLAALDEIAEGCIQRPPGHVDYPKNRTKTQIEAIARAAIATASGDTRG